MGEYDIMTRPDITNANKRLSLLDLLVKIAIDQDRPISLVEFVRLAFEAGFRTEASCYSYLILVALQTLVRRGVFRKHDAQSAKMPDQTIVCSVTYYSKRSDA